MELSPNLVGPGIPIAVNAVLTGFMDGETVAITLVFADGSTAELDTVTVNAGGMASVDLMYDAGLDSGLHALQASGSNGGKASDALHVK